MVTAAYILALPLLSSSICAQKDRPLSVEDALNVRYFGESHFRFSPDGEHLAYVLRENQKSNPDLRETQARTGVPWYAARADIWVVDRITGENANLTRGRGSNWSPLWSPDGRLLAFLSDRDGPGQARVWVWDVAKKDLRSVSDVAVRGEQIQWSHDGKLLFLTAVPRELSPEDYAKMVLSGRPPAYDGDSGKTTGSSVILFPPASDKQLSPISDPWNLNVYFRDLVSIEVNSGKVTRIVQHQKIAKFLLSPDASRLAYSRPNGFEKAGSQQILFDIVTVDALGVDERTLAHNIRLDYDGSAFSWSPIGTHLGIHSGGMSDKTRDCYVVDLKTGALENLTHFQPQGHWDRKAEAPVWDAEGKNLYFLNDGALWRAAPERTAGLKVAQIPDHEITSLLSPSDDRLWTLGNTNATVVVTHDDLGKQDGFYRVNLDTGQNAKLLERGECYTCTGENQFAVASERGSGLAYVAEAAGNSPDIWISSANFQKPRRLTHVNPQFDRYHFGAARLIAWSSADGEKLHGVLLLPSDYLEGRRYPLVVWVYGGDSLSDHFDHFGLGGPGPLNLQMLATRGYAVFLPDAPQHLGTPMLDLAKAILPGVDKVIDMGIADSDRLGVMGHSYGGYSVLSLIVQTSRFKAALEEDGMGDLISAYGQMQRDGTAYQISIIEQDQGLTGGTPWQFRERYIENSPLFYFDRVETPLLIVHGAADKAVAPFLGDQIYVALHRLGKVVEYAKYEGEDHSPLYWSYANQIDVCTRVIGWFDRYLGVRH